MRFILYYDSVVTAMLHNLGANFKSVKTSFESSPPGSNHFDPVPCRSALDCIFGGLGRQVGRSSDECFIGETLAWRKSLTREMCISSLGP
jgi:hypothetical protein